MDSFYLFCFSLVFIIIGYLLGSVLLGPILSRLKNIDLRSQGSKNVGSTNVLRTLGIKSGILTYTWDSIKSWIAIFLSIVIYSSSKNLSVFSNTNTFNESGYIVYLAGLFTVIGHCYPVKYMISLLKTKFNFNLSQEYKGGKGAAATAGFYMAISPWIFIICFISFWIILGATKYVSISSIVAIFIGFILSLVPNVNYMYMLDLGPPFTIINLEDSIQNFTNPQINFNVNWQYIYFVSFLVFIINGIVLFMHRENIKRLILHTESKINSKKTT